MAEYFARESGSIVVPAPSAEELDTVELHHMSLDTAVKRGVVDQLILEAVANDGAIDEQEKEKILTAHHKHIRSREGEIRATLLVYKK